VRRELLTHHLVVEKLGGDIQDVEVSALKGTNLLGLEEAILLQAEILSLQADPTLRAKGIVLETHVKKGHGNVATVLIQDGTLVKGDIFVAGMVLGRVRLLFDDKGKVLSKASLAQPVEVVGWTELPQPGDRLMVMPSDHAAKEFLDWKKELEASNKSEPLSIKTTLEQHLKDQHIKEFLLILKSDAQGSLEGILHELAKIQHEEVSLKVIHSAVGSINEGDVLLAQSMGAMLVGFNVSVLPEARKLIEQNESLHFFNHKVIYHVIEDVKKAMSGLLAVTYEEEFLGRAKVIQLFPVKKGPTVVGCGVREGLLRRGEHVRIVRGKETVYEGIIKNLRHVKEDVKEMAAGYECGAIFAGAYDIKLDDVVTCFSKKEIRRSV
jgi:translation initiation factor IF-2